jgi:acetyl/propionyl-CoA carboxylase alpha subunit
MISSLLIASHGENACRIINTLLNLGISTAAANADHGKQGRKANSNDGYH